MPKKGGCLFCEIQKEGNDAQMGVLERGARWFVILNMFPYANGHLMVVANRHIERVGEISPDEARELVPLLARCETAIREAYRPDGMNIGINVGQGAGAGIAGHLHVHLCPRWIGDTNFMTALDGTRVVSEALEESYRRLAPHFGKEGA
jgi:ATP adenylyltransferase